MHLSPEEVEERKSALEQRRREKEQLRRRRVVSYGIVLIVGLILMVVSGYVSYQRGMRGSNAHSDRPSSQAAAAHQQVNVLFMGTDEKIDSAARTDTLILASIDTSTGHIGLLSIPRDTRVYLAERNRWTRVNSAYVFGGPPLAMRAVADLVGIPVEFFVKTDFDGFRRIVDILGGVELTVEREMNYVDNAQDLRIHLLPGHQVLDGDKALQYVRYRDRLGDVSLVDPAFQTYDGRVERQRRFLEALAREVFQASVLPKLPQLIPEMWNMVETNLPLERMIRIGLAAGRFSADRIVSGVLPGDAGQINNAAYWIPDQERIPQVVSTVLGGRPVPIRVEVLNGSGQSGVARQAAQLIEDENVDILRLGNADRFDYDRSRIVVYRQELEERVHGLANLLGAEVQVEANNRARVDATIIMGRNFP